MRATGLWCDSQDSGIGQKPQRRKAETIEQNLEEILLDLQGSAGSRRRKAVALETCCAKARLQRLHELLTAAQRCGYAPGAFGVDSSMFTSHGQHCLQKAALSPGRLQVRKSPSDQLGEIAGPRMGLRQDEMCL